MSPEQLQRVEQLFDELRGSTPATRDERLIRARAEDPDVAAEVERLLSDDDPDRTLLALRKAVGSLLGQAGAATLDSLVGDRIGPYRMLTLLGEGGMGSVYLAQQNEPVYRRVAIKIIKPGMDSRQVLARFEAERQALSLMDHPNIAHVLDTGATTDGRPYFVMELVQGLPITEHCDRHRATLEERLNLFAHVCDAVHHAHQKGVIHRDLKPSNILVALHDDRAVPKIIDFGVAKALHQPLTQRTLFTEQGRLIGTPEYMSPEQADLTTQDIDTRSDIYALGVLLYELLTGTLPFDPRTLRDAGLAEIVRVIREVDPPMPSTRLQTLLEQGDEASQVVGKCRRTDIRSLRRTLSGDLDWITMKALEKERSRRYSAASDFAADVRRFLNNEPVLAARPSGLYRARKFVRRHRTGVFVAAVVGLALLIATAVSIWQMDEARHAQKLAQRDSARLRAVLDMINEMIAAAAPESKPKEVGSSAPESGAKDVRVLSMVNHMVADLDKRSDLGRPVEATLRTAIGRLYDSLLDSNRAKPQFEKAMKLWDVEFGGQETCESIEALSRLAWVDSTLNEESEHDDDPIASLKKCLAFVETHDCQTPTRDDLLVNLSHAMRRKGLIADARQMAQRALETAVKASPQKPKDVADAQYCLALALDESHDGDKAESYYLAALQTWRKLYGDDYVRCGEALVRLGSIYAEQGRKNEALTALNNARPILIREYGPDSSAAANCLNETVQLNRELGNCEEAISQAREVVRFYSATFVAPHRNIGIAIQTLARTLDLCGQSTEAVGPFEESIRMYVQSLGAESVYEAGVRWQYGDCLHRLGKAKEAAAEWSHARSIYAQLGEDKLAAEVAAKLAAPPDQAPTRHDPSP